MSSFYKIHPRFNFPIISVYLSVSPQETQKYPYFNSELIQIKYGDNFKLEFVIFENEKYKKDLSNYDLLFTLYNRERFENDSVTSSGTVIGGIEETDLPNGNFMVTFKNDINIPIGDHSFRLQATEKESLSSYTLMSNFISITKYL